MAPGFSYQEKVNQFNARFLSGLGKEFEAFGRTTTLGGLYSKLATGYDFGNLAAAAVTGDADLFAKTAAGMIGAYVGEIGTDRKSTRLNSSPSCASRMPFFA